MGLWMKGGDLTPIVTAFCGTASPSPAGRGQAPH